MVPRQARAMRRARRGRLRRWRCNNHRADRAMIASSGYQHTFLVFAIIYGVIIVVVSNFIRAPRAHDVPATIKIKVAQGDSGSAAVAGATVADVLDHVSDVLPGR